MNNQAAAAHAMAHEKAREVDVMEDRLDLDEKRLELDERKREDEKEHNKRMADVETMKAVDVTDQAGVDRLDQLKKDELDRENQQQLLDLLGDCIACIETDGKPND